MTVLVSDPDFVLHVGDVREELAARPDGSVDCVITSPPYWGLRDYGTGVWDGGNPDCDHVVFGGGPPESSTLVGTPQRGISDVTASPCRKCGARRQDQQLGLEPTPDAYITNMVAVFREVHRVLADHGTCWINLGDSYNSRPGGPQGETGDRADRTYTAEARKWRPGSGRADGIVDDRAQRNRNGVSAPGLKPKDLVGIPWRLAFALQADGWYLRADIIWAKPNPMPESVTDRPTKSHEYVFLLSKRPRYWFDQEAVREPSDALGPSWAERKAAAEVMRHGLDGAAANGSGGYGAAPGGRNVRSVWEIATQPYAEAHFATYPEELVRRCILAGCPERVCVSCGRPSERIVERSGGTTGQSWHDHSDDLGRGQQKSESGMDSYRVRDLGWSDCGCGSNRVGGVDATDADARDVENPAPHWRPGTVLDPFLGSGTTALVARKHGRRCVGIELNPEYAELAVRRNAQQTIWA